MKTVIHLNNREILQALLDYVVNKGLVRDGQYNVSVSFSQSAEKKAEANLTVEVPEP